MKAKFISIEGIEGVGKSTQLQLISHYLTEKKIAFITTREPGGTPLAEEIRQLLLQPREEKMAEDAELLLMFASRAQHLMQVIKPALAENKWVISDRFIDASYAYQGGGRGISLKRIDQLTEFTLGHFLPDLTLLLDATPAIGAVRAKNRGSSDRFEQERDSFFTKVREQYLQRAKAYPARIKIINAEGSIEETWQAIKNILDSLLV